MARNVAEEKLSLIMKLAKIRTLSDVAQKSKKGYNYTYTDITEILAKVTAGMKKYHVSLIPSIKPGTASVSQNVVSNTKVDKTGKSYTNTTTEMLFQAEMNFRWIDDDFEEDFIDVPWFVTGSMSDCAQAMGAGLTYTMRQFLTTFFQIAQSDMDVDAYRSKQKEAEVAEEKTIAAEIVAQFDGVVKEYLTDHSDDAEKIKKFISKYAKNGNYFSIKDPTIAAKLMEDFRETYINEKDTNKESANKGKVK